MNIFIYKEMMKVHETFLDKLKNYMNEFRELGNSEYTYEMYFKLCSINKLRDAVHNILITNVSAIMITAQEEYSFFPYFEEYNSNFSIEDAKKIEVEFKKLYDIFMCAIYEIEYVMYLSRYNEEHMHNGKLNKNKCEELRKKFEDAKKYLSDTGNSYNI